MKIFLKVILPIVLLVFIAVYFVFRKPNHDDAFDSVGLLEAKAEQLKATLVVSDLEEPLPENKNVLWCGTFQLAWNEVCGLLGEDIHFQGAEPDSVAGLNLHAFTKKDLDDASFIAIADYVKNDIYEKIPRELQKKFGGAACPRLIPKREITSGPSDIVAYAYLFKNLQFADPFEKLDEPLVFAGKQLPCFGISENDKSGQDKLRKQVVVLHYKDRDHFAIELKTKSADDRLILVKMAPEATLEETIAKFNREAAASKAMNPQFGGLLLQVPKLNFDITRRYSEFEHLPLALSKPTTDLQITSAMQNIRFQMDEKGVRLKSESHICIGCSANSPLPIDYYLIFDKPFLLLLQRTDAKVPYFALWVDNPEILATKRN